MLKHLVRKILILDYVEEMLKEGKDPKDKLIEYCKPNCVYWKDKLSRCEKKLEYEYLIVILLS